MSVALAGSSNCWFVASHWDVFVATLSTLPLSVCPLGFVCVPCGVWLSKQNNSPAEKASLSLRPGQDEEEKSHGTVCLPYPETFHH